MSDAGDWILEAAHAVGIFFNLENKKKSSVSSEMTEVVELNVVMHCEGCAGSVRKTLKKIPGVLSCTVDFETQRATVVGNVDRIDVLRRVHKSGKLASLIPKPPPPPPPPPEPPKEEPKEEPKAEEKKEEEKKEEPKPEEKKEEKKEEPKAEETKEEKKEEPKAEEKKEEAKAEEKKEEPKEEAKAEEKKEETKEEKKEEKAEEKKDEGKAEEKKEEAKPEEKKEEAKPEEPPKPKPWTPDFIQAPFYTLTYPSYYHTKAP